MLTLLTDLYQLTMAYGFWKEGISQKRAVFHHFFRKRPFDQPYATVAGLESLIHFLESFSFSESDLAYLETLEDSQGAPLFEKAFLDYLSSLQLELDIDAAPEGRAIFPHEPILRVQGPILQAQLIESALLNIVNFQTLIATKASLICSAAGSDPVVEFGLRRAQGIDGALSAARAAYIGGCVATSNTLAGKNFGIPVRGTHSHSWVMAFDEEKEAFQSFTRSFPNNSYFLIDTYHIEQGLEKAIEVAKHHSVLGVRLDSGDLASLSKYVRKRLDEVGLNHLKIMASNDLDENEIRLLKEQGAKIDVWGVGTRLVTGMSQPALDGVYKLSMIEGRSVIKTSKGKTSLPGVLNVRRYADHDVLHHGELSDESGEELLVPIYRSGKLVYTPPPLHVVRGEREQLLETHRVITHEGLLNDRDFLMKKVSHVCPSVD